MHLYTSSFRMDPKTILMKEQAFATAKHAVLLEETESNSLHKKIHQLQIISTAISDTSHPCKLCMDIYMCIYILTHRVHWVIGISSAAVQYINIHVIVIYKNINILKYVRHYGWGTVVQCSESCNTNNLSGVYASSVYILLMQDHMQREKNPS